MSELVQRNSARSAREKRFAKKKPRSASSAVKQRQAHNVRTHWAQDPLAARAPLYKERPCKSAAVRAPYFTRVCALQSEAARLAAAVGQALRHGQEEQDKGHLVKVLPQPGRQRAERALEEVDLCRRPCGTSRRIGEPALPRLLPAPEHVPQARPRLRPAPANRPPGPCGAGHRWPRLSARCGQNRLGGAQQ